MFLVSGVDLITPLSRLLIQVSPVGELTAGQEVCLYEPEGPFYPPGTVGIADCMGDELKPETLAKRRHLRHGNHVATGAAQHHHVRVIDHHAGRAAAEVSERVGEEYLAVEALKGWIELKEQHPRVTQHGRGGLHLPRFST